MTGESLDPPRPLDPGLYLVATPIGNLQDLSFRALDVLKRCDRILAEDTRVTAKLLAAFGVRKRLERFDDHAGEDRRRAVLTSLAAGECIALVSDAGTPLVSDPGYLLVRDAVAEGLAVTPIPGPSAAIAALCVSGLPTDRFLFAGFAPAKSAARRAFFEELAEVRATLVLFESGPRLRASLGDMAHVFGPRDAAVVRELTKLYETVVRGPLSALIEDPRLDAPKGEIVVVVGPGTRAAPAEAEVDAALAEALGRLAPSAAAAEVARALGLPKKALYRKALDLRAAQAKDL
jgi:16S rRNA (cytidine1402-2'-O)-methyltransferase